MAQKFGNFRWVEKGFLDNRTTNVVVGQLTFAGIGTVDFCLSGQLTGEITEKVICFKNSKFIDDPRALDALADFQAPQIGKVSLISFDPHPLLAPHPYIEWFAQDETHYRIELEPDDAWIATELEIKEIDAVSQSIRDKFKALI